MITEFDVQFGLFAYDEDAGEFLPVHRNPDRASAYTTDIDAIQKLSDIYTQLGSGIPVTGPLTDAQLRATPVPVSGPLTSAQLAAAGLNEEATQLIVAAALTASLDVALSTRATETSLLAAIAKLNDIKSAVEAIAIDADTIAIDADTINLNTDELESLLQQIRDRLPVAIGQQLSNASLAVALSTQQEAILATIASELASIQAQLPSTLGQKANAASLAVTLSTEQQALIQQIKDAFPASGDDLTNEYIGALGAGQVGPGSNAPGAWRDVSQMGSFLVFVLADQPWSTSAPPRIEWSNDGVNELFLNRSTIPLQQTKVTTPSPATYYYGLSPVNSPLFRGKYMRVRVEANAAQGITYILTLNGKFPITGTVKPLVESLNQLSIAQLVQAQLVTAIPGGQFGAVGLAGKALDADVTPSGSIFAEHIRDDIKHDWSNDDPNLTLNKTLTGSATLDKLLSQCRWRTGTTPGSTIVTETKQTVFYSAAHGLEFEFTTCFAVPPTTSDGYIFKGAAAVGGTDGFMVGYKGTDFGVLHRRSSDGFTGFVKTSDFNIDQLTGQKGSEFTKLGVPIVMDPSKNQRWRVIGALLGSETWALQIRSPDRRWVTCHLFFWLNEQTVNIVEVFDMKMRLEASNGSSSTNVEMRSGSARGGLYTSDASEHTRLLQRYVNDTDELRIDVEPTSSSYYIGVAADGSGTADAVWNIVRVYLSATRNPTRTRFRKRVAWDSRTVGWT